ncbi:MAG: hypothetical protein A3K19_17065 [Lentisphaerae bacterium RIFOXYB12_FULL_65_16]|nr:MAG: hypothetical protein A3K18_03680 [Lentisphaerae bacterium RIFOXYA12_64_32]OGV87696.1 MAG: hypothetical protein A3K19_17065 [Lentisphaerae bacterium RIFOXYB12_FULL_65_16]
MHPLPRLTLALISLLALQLSAAPAGMRFSAPLRAGPDAVSATGSGTAIVHHDTTGQDAWPVRGPHDGISWLAPENLDKARGTLAFGFRAGWDRLDSRSRALICDDRSFNVKEENALRLWKWDHRCLRFDLRSTQDKYLTVPLEPLADGAWHHLAVSWDSDKGLRVFVDGQRAAGNDAPFTAKPSARLNLGHGESLEPGLGEYRDLVILDRMIEDDEAAALAAGKLELQPVAPAAPAAATGPAAAADSAVPKVTFHAGFEDTLVADTAAAGGEPRRAEQVTFVDSPFGRAAWFGEGAALEYAGEANLPHDRGTLTMWVRPDWTAADAKDWRFFLRESPPDRPGDDCRWLWFQGGDMGRFRFDMRLPGDPYVYAPQTTWRAGSWHHLAMTWDAARGEFDYYFDGAPIQSRSDSQKIFLRQTWTPQPKPFFWVGNWDGKSTARAAIDELTIYDRPLAPDAILREACRMAPVSATVDRPYLDAGTTRVDVTVRNRSPEKIEAPLVATVTKAGAEPVRQALGTFTLGPGESRVVPLTLPDGEPGDRVIEVMPENQQPGPAAWCHICRPETPRAGAPTEKLLARIDLTENLAPEQFCDDRNSRVFGSPLGSYRQAGDAEGSRFAVRLHFDQLGAWHRLEWEWPDDKPRTVDVILNRGRYDVASGTLAGDEYPNTNTMRRQIAYCWPRKQDDALVFMTCEPARPAAVANVSVTELSGPPAPLAMPDPRFRNARGREVGLYYEDPVLSMNLGGEARFPEFADVVDRLLAYMDACGMNTLYYPAVWYHGPLYPSPSQGSGQSAGRPHPPDFLRYLLRRFESRGIRLVVTFNVHDLPSLARVETDEARVQAGTPTPISVLWNGGLKLAGWHGTPGDFNPLDPAVHEPVRELVRELATRYADSPAFGGVCLHLPRHSMLWFGHLEGGYNDINLKRFQDDTGIRLEIDPRDPLRANRAYRQLVNQHRDKWLDWRCSRIAAQWGEYAAILRQARPDLALAVNLYTVLDESKNQDLRTPPDTVDYMAEAREYGADVRMLAQIPNVLMMNTFSPGLYRWHRSRNAPAKPEQLVFRNACFASSAYVPFATLGAPFGVNLHDKYWEDDIASKHGLPGLKEWGQPELGWRVSTPVPPAPYALENYAEALGQADIRLMTKGGFVIGTVGIEDQIAGWAAAFRQLPDAPFEDVPALADPVRVRCARRDDGDWAYVQNRLADPVRCALTVDGAGPLTDLAAAQDRPLTNGQVELTLPGYGLVALWAPAGQARITGGTILATTVTTARLTGQLAALRAAAEKADAPVRDWAAPRLDLATRLLNEGRLAQASHVLEEPWSATLLSK